jgi:hypothetical protein
LNCYLALGWPLPENVLDLFTEFRCITNGKAVPCGNGLLGALAYNGLDSIAAVEKDNMRALAMRGGPYTTEEMAALLDYCRSDVEALERLLPRMLPHLDLPRALVRGRYMKASARMETSGVPIDVPTFKLLRDNWIGIQNDLIRLINDDFDVYEGRTFKTEKFKRYLTKQNLAWPQDKAGRLRLDDDTLKEMTRVYPQIGPLRELRVSLSQMRLSDLAVGRDGRNRTILSAFSAVTGRNAPSNSKFIFGPSVWLRFLIRPAPGMSLAYVDWEQQEFGIGAALSRDRAMLQAYTSGDPYIAFAKQSGAVPENATKTSHGPIRELFKTCALGVQYGMGAESLAVRIQQPLAYARELLRLHREIYKRFWRWSDAASDFAMLHGYLNTVFGWRVVVGENVNPRSLRNYPMQANGAEMLRLACCYATERGIRVCAPVHDAVLIEAPIAELEVAVAATQRAMAQASAAVLNGFELRSEAKLIHYPDRYEDERGKRMWATVWEELSKLGLPGGV